MRETKEDRSIGLEPGQALRRPGQLQRSTADPSHLSPIPEIPERPKGWTSSSRRANQIYLRAEVWGSLPHVHCPTPNPERLQGVEGSGMSRWISQRCQNKTPIKLLRILGSSVFVALFCYRESPLWLPSSGGRLLNSYRICISLAVQQFPI